MIKINPPMSWNDLHRGPQLEEIKYAASGFRGEDFRAFTKRASHDLAQWVRGNPPLAGETYSHLHAMGSTELYGANRNADGYRDEMLRRDHPTFEKYAHFYLDHKNTDPRRSYGLVKRSWYNEPLNRVELIVALNATKEAAERNKGLVAERTLHKLASDVDVAVSQSCRVPGDRCVSCGNWAKTRREYCGPENCKYGGCRDNLGKTFDDGFHLYVDNPHCTFFDISDVSSTRGADRTAFITGKVANADLKVVGGAELAELLGLVPPEHLLDRNTIRAAGCLRKLASVNHPHEGAPDWDTCLEVRARNKTAHSHQAPVFRGAEHNRHATLAELGAAGVVLPPARWLSATTGAPVEKCAQVFTNGVDAKRDLLDRDDLHDVLESQSLQMQDDNRLSASKYAWMSPTIKDHGLESVYGYVRTVHQDKTAAVQAPEQVRKEAAAAYLAYQARVLAFHENSPNFDLLLSECARHNRGTTV